MGSSPDLYEFVGSDVPYFDGPVRTSGYHTGIIRMEVDTINDTSRGWVDWKLGRESQVR